MIAHFYHYFIANGTDFQVRRHRNRVISVRDRSDSRLNGIFKNKRTTFHLKNESTFD